MQPGAGSPDVVRYTFAILFIALLTAACLWILQPFLTAAIWATTTAIATWPLLQSLEAKLGGRGRAVTVLVIGFLLLLIVPAALSVIALIDNAGRVAEKLQSLKTTGLPLAPPQLEQIPVIGPKLTASWNQLAAPGPDSLLAYVGSHAGTLFHGLVSRLGDVGKLILQFILTIIIAGVLYSSGEKAAEGVLRFGRRLAGDAGEQAMILAGKAIRGVALGVVGTALIQTGLAGLGLVIVGFPGASILTALIFVLCLAQLGPILIMVPAAVYLLMSDQTAWGTFLLIWGIAVGLLDNFVRPVLIKKGVDLPFLLILSGVIGGLLAFGVIGIFIGPVVLAVSSTLLSYWIGGPRVSSSQNT